MNRHRLLLTTFIGALCFITGFSGTTSREVSKNTSRNGRPVNSSIDAVYAPFDTLRTDLEDYIWPTNASTIITSSFADYRRTHLHEGIDISTNNQKGYPVYAARDGYVSHIFISRRGYGKMLTVRHLDSFITMYAHLQRFMDPIDDYVKKIQKRSRRYSLDMDVDSTMFRVSKGDVIAFSGSTGIGAAHLHFELRDSSFNPINPFLLPQISSAIRDQVPPVFHMVGFTPLSRSTKIQGKNKVWTGNPKRDESASYVLQQPVKLSGSVGISVWATDQSDVLKYKTGPYRFELYLDNHLLFSSAKNYILESESHLVSAYYDKSLLRLRKGRFEKLYIESGNRLPFYNRLPEGAGRIDTSDYEEGQHVLRIVTWDLAGNESTLTAIIVLSDRSNR